MEVGVAEDDLTALVFEEQSLAFIAQVGGQVGVQGQVEAQGSRPAGQRGRFDAKAVFQTARAINVATNSVFSIRGKGYANNKPTINSQRKTMTVRSKSKEVSVARISVSYPKNIILAKDSTLNLINISKKLSWMIKGREFAMIV